MINVGRNAREETQTDKWLGRKELKHHFASLPRFITIFWTKIIEFHNKISEPKYLFLVLLGLGRLAAATLLGEEDSVDVGEHTALGNGHTGQQFIQFLVIANSELNIKMKEVPITIHIFPT